MLFKKLPSGNDMPALGLGTWQSKADEVYNAVIAAIKAGYRHFDTAFIYQNEAELGRAFKKCFEDKIVKREDLFVTSKVWNIDHAPGDVKKECKESLKLLGFDYLDLYLMHWPMGYQNNGELFPKNSDGKFIYSDVDYVDTFNAMEKLVEEGLVRNIGLSNFNKDQVERVWKNSKIKPSVLQVECHPFFQQNELVKYTAGKGIIFTAYSPLGSPERPWAKASDRKVLDEPILQEIGKKYKKTTANVVTRWLLQRGVVVIPKSVTPERIEQNFKVFDFELNDKEMDSIAGVDINRRGCVLEWVSDHPFYPF